MLRASPAQHRSLAPRPNVSAGERRPAPVGALLPGTTTMNSGSVVSQGAIRPCYRRLICRGMNDLVLARSSHWLGGFFAQPGLTLVDVLHDCLSVRSNTAIFQSSTPSLVTFRSRTQELGRSGLRPATGFGQFPVVSSSPLPCGSRSASAREDSPKSQLWYVHAVQSG